MPSPFYLQTFVLNLRYLIENIIEKEIQKFMFYLIGLRKFYGRINLFYIFLQMLQKFTAKEIKFFVKGYLANILTLIW